MSRLKELDEDTLGERWTDAHFLYELPQKWVLSRAAKLGEMIDGFVVASRKPESVHIHRVAVDRRLRGQGVGAALVAAVAKVSMAGDGAPVSLKVGVSNTSARALYARLGFVVVESSVDQLVMEAGAGAIVAAWQTRASRDAS